MNNLSRGKKQPKKNHTARATLNAGKVHKGVGANERRTPQDENKTELKGRTGKGMRRREEEAAAGAAGREN